MTGFFDMDGIPVRRVSDLSVPEKMLPDGTWQPFYDTYRFSFATPVDETSFKQLMAEFTSKTEGQEEKSMGESSGTSGGYLVPTEGFDDL
jgi:hypothetical protein